MPTFKPLVSLVPRRAGSDAWLYRTWALMHHKVVGNFGSEADVGSLYYRHFRFNQTSDVAACTHGRPAK